MKKESLILKKKCNETKIMNVIIVKLKDSGVGLILCNFLRHTLCYHRVDPKIKGVHLVKITNSLGYIMTLSFS